MRSVLFLVLAATLCAQNPAPLSSPSETQLAELGVRDVRRAAFSNTPAALWETAFMTGSGETGALVMGRPNDDTVILSRGGLFLPLSKPLNPPSQGKHLKQIRAMIAAGDYQKAADFVFNLAEKEGYKGTHWVDPFVPVCSLKIGTAVRGGARDYLRTLDYSTGVTSTRWADEGGIWIQRVFASRPLDAIVVSLERQGAPADITLGFVQHDPSVTRENDRVHEQAFAKVEASADSDGLSFHSRFANQWKRAAHSAFALARVSSDSTSREAAEGTLHLRSAKNVLLVIKVGSDPDPRGQTEEAARAALRAAPQGYGELLQPHVREHGALFARSRLNLNGRAEDHALPARQLFEKSDLDEPLAALLEKQYDACRYLILSCTGRYFPPTLQGIWSGTWNPPWASAFTHDGNVPVAVIGNLPANLPELMEGYFSYHERQIADYRENARHLFGTRGIVLPAHSTSHGLHNHFGPRWCLTFWSGGAAWAAHYFYDYYLYTGDEDFLRRRAIPFMKETALFYEDFLAGMEDEEGFAVFSPSYSPENDPANTGSQASVNATMDIAACRELLRNLVTGCERLGIEAEGVARWKKLLEKLRPYRINEDGAVAEWATPSLKDNYAHRHVSHLYELYDSLPDHIGRDPALMQAFKVALEKRTQWRRQIGGGEMAFGQAQMGAVAASLRLPDLAYENLAMLADWFWFPDSMMTAHNPESLFNTDIAGGIPQLIIRMLIDSQPGWIEVLPALPRQWPTGTIEGVLCRGQIEVKKLEWSAERIELTLVSKTDQTIELRNHGGKFQQSLPLKAATPVTVTLSR